MLQKLAESKNYKKIRDHCHYAGKYRDTAHSICDLKINMPNKISVLFHNGSNYDYLFIIKKLANEFEGKSECLGENTETYTNFFVPIKKEVIKIDNEGHESVVTLSYKIKLIDSARFMATSLLTEGIPKIKCKDCDFFLD